MRIIQSAWSCHQENLLTSNSGWLSPEYNLMSWTLSCLQLRQFYPEVVLYCDSQYKELLIGKLELPYSEVVCTLDHLNTYHKELWALPKIYSYSLQKEPFIHIDGDVFIWKSFEPSLLEANLITQNMEAATDYYGIIMEGLKKNLTYFPDEIMQEQKVNNAILAYNAGIMGGSDISFFEEYTQKAFEFVDKNLQNLSKIEVTNFNVFFEQYLFYCMAKEKNKEVAVLIPEIIGDNRYKGFGDFEKVPFEKQYLHLLGDYKRNSFICKQMAARLRNDFPNYYYKIIDLFKSNKAPLCRDNYFFIENCSKKILIQRSIKLQSDYHSNTLAKSLPSKRILKPLKIETILSESTKKSLNGNQLQDLTILVKKINTIRQNSFSFLSLDFLYARDLVQINYFQHLFEKEEKTLDRILIRDEPIVFVESQYDWSFLFDNVTKWVSKMELEKTLKKTKFILIPECTELGFSISKIDELDEILLEILQQKTTIHNLLEKLKIYFDKEELDNSFADFKKLIFGRIEQGIHNKSIKVLF
jgi:hypothetical protein